ncbi:MAG: hypothetical protein OEY56_03645 [Cyclobacteriaceae bacterium]|nr:hypothetical protein [Cyclobacteriaceae bacterium]
MRALPCNKPSRKEGFFYWGIIAALMLVLNSCTKDTTVYAEDQNYYFLFIDLENTAGSQSDLMAITSMLPVKKYIITNESGLDWPFFASYDLDEKVPADSIMAPHLYIHRFIPWPGEENTAIGDVKLTISYHYDAKQQPVLGIVKHEKDSTGWGHQVDTGTHIVEDKYYSTEGEKQLRAYQTIVRYSFK